MALLRPYIYSSNAKEQADYYADIFEGEVSGIRTFDELPGGQRHVGQRVMHLTLHIAGQVFYMADREQLQEGNMIDLSLEFESDEIASRTFERFVARGGVVLVPYAHMVDGVSFGRIRDRYGLLWQLAYVHES